MMRFLPIAAVVLLLVAAEGSAGLFFRRDGNPRQPVRATVQAARNVVQNVAARRESRGAVAVLPRVRSAALAQGGAVGSSCGSCSAGYGIASYGAACTSPECLEAEAIAAAANAARASGEFAAGVSSRARREVFSRALYLFASVHDRQLADAVHRIRSDPRKVDRFRQACAAEFGIDPTTIREWLKLFFEYAPQLIELIRRFI